MDDLKKQVEELSKNVADSIRQLAIDEIASTRDEIRKKMQSPDFWSNPVDAQELSKQEARLSQKVDPWLKLKQDIQESQDLIKMNDESMFSELQEQISSIDTRYKELKKELRFAGPYDDHDVLLSVYAGAGGTDAQDWAQMLLRMYLRWAENQKLKTENIDQSLGEEAGIKSATVKITGGNFLYGKLAGEHGVHRLVRMSPFNSAGSRETSFAKVDIMPLVNKPEEVQLDENDLKIDVYRAGGHGGQSVNTTDSAVRVTHLPTGVAVAIQNERSQLQNKETALAILRSKLIQLQTEQHAKSLADIKGPNQSAEWGNQIRSYVLHPYKQVKDLRTGFETSDPDKVLNGGLQPFIEAWIERQTV